MESRMTRTDSSANANPTTAPRTPSDAFSPEAVGETRSTGHAASALGQGAPFTPEAVLHLQRTIGNQATSALLRAQLAGSSASPRIQRRVETFQATRDKVMYFSTYGRALDELNNPLFETREEAQEYDDKMKIQWELLQKGGSGGTMEHTSSGASTMTLEKPSFVSTVVLEEPEKEKEKGTSSSTSSTPSSSSDLTVEPPATTPIRQGLIHGTYIRASNSVDLHVDSKGGGEGLSILDMLSASQTIYRLMAQRSQEKGAPKGTFILHPTGAAIVKIVVQTLGEALGTAQGIRQARELVAKRKVWEKISFWKTKSFSTEKLDPSVISEHVAYLQAIVNIPGVSISPVLAASITGAKTLEEFTQNMLENSEAGRTRFRLYEETLRAQEVSVSLDITLTEDQLPQIIQLLAKYGSSAKD